MGRIALFPSQQMMQNARKGKSVSPWAFSGDQQYPGFVIINAGVRGNLRSGMNASAGQHSCVGVVLMSAHRTLEDGASHAALPAIDMQGGEWAAHRDAQNAAHYQRWQMITCRSLVETLPAITASPHGKIGTKPCARLSRLSTPTWGSEWMTHLSSFPLQLIKKWSHSAPACQDSSAEKKHILFKRP